MHSCLLVLIVTATVRVRWDFALVPWVSKFAMPSETFYYDFCLNWGSLLLSLLHWRSWRMFWSAYILPLFPFSNMCILSPVFMRLSQILTLPRPTGVVLVPSIGRSVMLLLKQLCPEIHIEDTLLGFVMLFRALWQSHTSPSFVV